MCIKNECGFFPVVGVVVAETRGYVCTLKALQFSFFLQMVARHIRKQAR